MQCSGFIYGLSTADQFIKTGMYKNVLVIGAENHQGIRFHHARKRVSVIFGDGAGAAVLTREENTDKGILSTHLYSEGSMQKSYLTGPSTQRRYQKLWKPTIQTM